MRLPRRTILALALLALAQIGGCSTAVDSTEGPPGGETERVAEENGDPFASGVLNVIADSAPAGSVSLFLARLAAGFGWEDQVAQNALLHKAVLEEQFEQRVEPFLLTLYYQNGFSVLPVVGEGHQFNRDTVVRGAVGSSRLLVTNRNPIRIIFLQPVENVQIVYHQDGEQPQVFSVDEQAVVAVRQSLLKYYLR